MYLDLDHPLLVILAAWLLHKRQPAPRKIVAVEPREIIHSRMLNIETFFERTQLRMTWLDKVLARIIARYLTRLDNADTWYYRTHIVAQGFIHGPKE